MTTKGGNPAVALAPSPTLATAVGSFLANHPIKANPGDEKLDYLIEGQAIMIQQLQRLVELGEQQVAPGIVTVPLDTEVLNRALQAAAIRGRTWFLTTSFTWLCAAGVTTVYDVDLPKGILSTEREATLSSDFYDPNIFVNVFADDALMTLIPVPLTREIPMSFGEYYVKRYKVRFVTINGTATDAQLTWVKTTTLMEDSFYEEFYKPIVDYMFASLQAVARIQRGK